MLLKNATLFLQGRFQTGDLRVEDGRIIEIGQNLPGAGADLAGDYLLPGLVDLHTHGCGGFDFDHADEKQLRRMEQLYASRGTTAVLATLMTNPRPVMLAAAERLGFYSGSVIRGIYLEGPFFGAEMRGAHREEWLSPPDSVFFSALAQKSRGKLRIAAIDPALPGAITWIADHAAHFRLSLGHTACDAQTAQAAFSAGAGQVTHLFNAMRGLHHRAPGLLGEALAGNAFCELICDGVHIHPTVLRLAFAALGKRATVISDSMSACGLGDGCYTLGGQQVQVKGSRATLADGTLAGSVTFAYEGVLQLIRAGVAPEDAFFAATATPAKAAGLDSVCGCIAPGRSADLIRAGRDWQRKQVWLAGRPQIREGISDGNLSDVDGIAY